MVVYPCFSQCSQCTLYPTGEVLCDITSDPAEDLCDQLIPGHAKRFNPSIEKKEQEKVLSQRVPRAKFSKPRKLTTRTKKQSKPIKGTQASLF